MSIDGGVPRLDGAQGKRQVRQAMFEPNVFRYCSTFEESSCVSMAPFPIDTQLHFAPLNICSLSYNAG